MTESLSAHGSQNLNLSLGGVWVGGGAPRGKQCGEILLRCFGVLVGLVEVAADLAATRLDSGRAAGTGIAPDAHAMVAGRSRCAAAGSS